MFRELRASCSPCIYQMHDFARTLSPTHTADADATVELSRVRGVYGIRNQLATVSTSLDKFSESEVELRRVGCVNAVAHPSGVVTQFTNVLRCWAILKLVTTKWRHCWKKVIIIDQNSHIKPLWCLVSFHVVDRIRRQSSWTSCEFCLHRRRRRDSTVKSRRRRRCELDITVDNRDMDILILLCSIFRASSAVFNDAVTNNFIF